jgi:hypothetical protein
MVSNSLHFCIISVHWRLKMESLLKDLEERLAKDIKDSWHHAHWGEMPEKTFKREYDNACAKIVHHLIDVGTKDGWDEF